MKGIPKTIESFLDTEASKLTKPNDLYYAYLLNEKATLFGLKDSKMNFLSQQMKEILNHYDKNEWALTDTERDGLTLESLRVTKIIASL